MQPQRGFTLIELVAVIVLLGILSVTALPRFFDLSRDARIAVLNGLHSSIQVAAEQAKLKATIAGAHNNPRSSSSSLPSVSINGQIVELKYGYPEAWAEEADANDILDLITISDELSVCYSISCINSNSSRVKIGFDTTEGIGCYVRYSEPGGTGAPSDREYGLILVTNGC